MVPTGKPEVLEEKKIIMRVVRELMVMERLCNVTDRETWSFQIEKLYSVHGMWMNDNGALVEWHSQGKTEVLGEKLYVLFRYLIECVLCVVGMVLTRENWSIGRENFYSVGGRWLKVYESLVELYWKGKFELLREEYYIVLMAFEWLFMD